MNEDENGPVYGSLRSSIMASLLGEKYTMDVSTVADIVTPWLLRNYYVIPKKVQRQRHTKHKRR